MGAQNVRRLQVSFSRDSCHWRWPKSSGFHS